MEYREGGEVANRQALSCLNPVVGFKTSCASLRRFKTPEPTKYISDLAMPWKNASRLREGDDVS